MARRRMLGLLVGAWSVLQPSLIFPADPDAPQSLAESFKEADKTAFLEAKGFTLARTVAAIPEPVAEAMARLTHTAKLEMAEPGQPYQAVDVILVKGLPWRRLIFVARSKDFCALQYERGGIGRVRVALVFALRGEAADLVWGGAVAETFHDLTSLRAAIREGRIQTKWIESNL